MTRNERMLTDVRQRLAREIVRAGADSPATRRAREILRLPPPRNAAVTCRLHGVEWRACEKCSR